MATQTQQWESLDSVFDHIDDSLPEQKIKAVSELSNLFVFEGSPSFEPTAELTVSFAQKLYTCYARSFSQENKSLDVKTAVQIAHNYLLALREHVTFGNKELSSKLVETATKVLEIIETCKKESGQKKLFQQEKSAYELEKTVLQAKVWSQQQHSTARAYLERVHGELKNHAVTKAEEKVRSIEKSKELISDLWNKYFASAISKHPSASVESIQRQFWEKCIRVYDAKHGTNLHSDGEETEKKIVGARTELGKIKKMIHPDCGMNQETHFEKLSNSYDTKEKALHVAEAQEKELSPKITCIEEKIFEKEEQIKKILVAQQTRKTKAYTALQSVFEKEYNTLTAPVQISRISEPAETRVMVMPGAIYINGSGDGSALATLLQMRGVPQQPDVVNAELSVESLQRMMGVPYDKLSNVLRFIGSSDSLDLNARKTVRRQLQSGNILGAAQAIKQAGLSFPSPDKAKDILSEVR